MPVPLPFGVPEARSRQAYYGSDIKGGDFLAPNPFGLGDDFDSAYSQYQTAAQQAEALGQPTERSGGLLSGVADTLDKFVSAGSGFFTGLLGADLVTDDGTVDRSEGGLGEALRRAGEGASGRHIGWGDWEPLRFAEDDTGIERFGKGLAAFTGDVLSDPLTYISFGTSIGRGAASRVAAGQLSKVAKESAEELFEAAGRQSLGDAAETATRRQVIEEGKRSVVSELDNRTILGTVFDKNNISWEDAGRIYDPASQQSIPQALADRLGTEDIFDVDTRKLVDLLDEQDLDKVIRTVDGGVSALSPRSKTLPESAMPGSVGQSLTELAVNTLGEGAYRIGGARRLRSELNRVFGEYGDDVFRRMHPDVKGGARLRVPLLREDPVSGARGFGFLGDRPRASIPLYPGQAGGGQVIDSRVGQLLGLDKVADSMEAVRKWVSSRQLSLSIADKLGGKWGGLSAKIMADVARAAADEAESPGQFTRLVAHRLADEGRERFRLQATDAYEALIRNVPDEWKTDTAVHRQVNDLLANPDRMASMSDDELGDVGRWARELREFYDRWGTQLEELELIPPTGEGRRVNYIPHLVKDEYLDEVRRIRINRNPNQRGTNVGSGHGNLKARLFDDFWADNEEFLKARGIDQFALEDPALFNQMIAEITDGRISDVFVENPFEVFNEYQRRMLSLVAEYHYAALMQRLGILIEGDALNDIIRRKGGPQMFRGAGPDPDDGTPPPGPATPPPEADLTDVVTDVVDPGPAQLEPPWRGGQRVTPPGYPPRTAGGLPEPTSAGIPDGARVDVSTVPGDMEPSPRLGEVVTPPSQRREPLAGMAQRDPVTGETANTYVRRSLKDKLASLTRRVQVTASEEEALDPAQYAALQQARQVLDMVTQTREGIEAAAGVRGGVSLEDAQTATDQALAALDNAGVPLDPTPARAAQAATEDVAAEAAGEAADTVPAVADALGIPDEGNNFAFVQRLVDEPTDQRIGQAARYFGLDEDDVRRAVTGETAQGAAARPGGLSERMESYLEQQGFELHDQFVPGTDEYVGSTWRYDPNDSYRTGIEVEVEPVHTLGPDGPTDHRFRVVTRDYDAGGPAGFELNEAQFVDEDEAIEFAREQTKAARARANGDVSAKPAVAADDVVDADPDIAAFAADLGVDGPPKGGPRAGLRRLLDADDLTDIEVQSSARYFGVDEDRFRAALARARGEVDEAEEAAAETVDDIVQEATRTEDVAGWHIGKAAEALQAGDERAALQHQQAAGQSMHTMRVVDQPDAAAREYVDRVRRALGMEADEAAEDVAEGVSDPGVEAILQATRQEADDAPSYIGPATPEQIRPLVRENPDVEVWKEARQIAPIRDQVAQKHPVATMDTRTLATLMKQIDESNVGFVGFGTQGKAIGDVAHDLSRNAHVEDIEQILEDIETYHAERLLRANGLTLEDVLGTPSDDARRLATGLGMDDFAAMGEAERIGVLGRMVADMQDGLTVTPGQAAAERAARNIDDPLGYGADEVDDLLDVTPPKPEPAAATTDVAKIDEEVPGALRRPSGDPGRQTFADADLTDFEIEGPGMASPAYWRKRRLSAKRMFKARKTGTKPSRMRVSRQDEAFDAPMTHGGGGNAPEGTYYTNRSSVVRVPTPDEVDSARATKRLKSWHRHLDKKVKTDAQGEPLPTAEVDVGRLIPDPDQWGDPAVPVRLRSESGRLYVDVATPDGRTVTLDGEDWRVFEEVAETLTDTDDLDEALDLLTVHVDSGPADLAVVTFDGEVLGAMKPLPPTPAGAADVTPDVAARALAQESVSLLESVERSVAAKIRGILDGLPGRTEGSPIPPTGPPDETLTRSQQGLTVPEFFARQREIADNRLPIPYEEPRPDPNWRLNRFGGDRLPVPYEARSAVFGSELEAETYDDLLDALMGVYEREQTRRYGRPFRFGQEVGDEGVDLPPTGGEFPQPRPAEGGRYRDVADEKIEEAILAFDEFPHAPQSYTQPDFTAPAEVRKPNPGGRKNRLELIAKAAGLDYQDAIVGSGRKGRQAPPVRDSKIYHGLLMDDFTRDALKRFGKEGQWETFATAAFEPYMRWFRTQATVGRGPGFVVRNMVGGLANARLVGATTGDMLDGMAVARMWARADRQVTAGSGGKRLFGVALNEARHDAFEELVRARWSDDVADQIMEAHDIFIAQGLADISQMSLAELARFTGRSRLFDQKDYDELGTVEKVFEKTALGIAPVTRTTSDWTKQAEHALRFGSFMAGARRYGIEDGGYAASMLTKASQFDYGDLSSFERNVMRQVIPFYTFTRKNLTLNLRSLFTDPAKFAHLQRGMEYVQEGLAAEEGSEGDAYSTVLPEWLEENMGFVSGIGLGGGVAGVRAESPKVHLEQWLPNPFAPIDSRQQVDTAVSQSNPLFDIVIGGLTDRDPYTGQEIGTGDSSAGKFDWFLRQGSPLYANISRLAPAAPGPNPIPWSTDRDESRSLGAWLSTFAGVPVATIDEDAARGALRARARELLGPTNERLDQLSEELNLAPEELKRLIREYGRDGAAAVLGVPSGTLVME